MIQKDIIETEIRTRGFDSVQEGILKTNKALAEYEDNIAKLVYQKNLLIAANKKETAEYKALDTEIEKLNSLRKNELAINKQLKSQLDLTAMSYNQLKSRASELKRELYNLDPNAPAFASLSKELGKVEKQMAKVGTAIKSTSKDINEGGSIWSKALGGIKGLIPVASLAAAGAAIKRIIIDTYQAAKEYQVEHARNMRILGDAYGYVSVQAEKLGKKMGVTNNEFVSATASVAEILQPLDFSRDKSAKMSVEVQKLSGALNEWTKGSIGVEKITGILTNAMLGQTEQARALGIVINKDNEIFKARVKTLQDEQGLSKEQAQALSVLEEAYRQTSDAQGAFGSSTTNILQIEQNANRAFRSAKEGIIDIIALSPQERLEKLQMRTRALTESMEEQTRTLPSLIAKYESLISKENLTASEHKELNGVIDKLIQIAPSAVSKQDDYGRAIEINTGRLKDIVKWQDEYNKRMTGQVNDKTFDRLKKDAKELDELSGKLEKAGDAVSKAHERRAKGPKSSEEIAPGIITSESEQDLNNYVESAEKNLGKINAKIQTLNTNLQANISSLVEAGFSYGQIAQQLNRSPKFVIDLHQQLKEQQKIREAAEAAAKKAAEDAAARVKKQEEDEKKQKERARENEQEAKRRAAEEKTRVENEVKARAAAIRESLSLQEQEREKYLDKLKAAGITEVEISAIQKKSVEDQTEEEKNKLAAFLSLNKAYQKNLGKVRDDSMKAWQTKEEAAFNKRMVKLKTEQNEELASIQTLEEAKELLRDKYGVEDLKKIKTLGDAQKAIRKEHEKEQAKETSEFLQKLATDLQNIIETGAFDDINLLDGILTDEEVADLQAKLDAIKLKLAEMRAAANDKSGEKSEEGEKKGFSYSSIGGQTDILGMSQEDWVRFMENIQAGTFGIEEMIVTVALLTNAFQQYDQIVTAAEERQMRRRERDTQRRIADAKLEYELGMRSAESLEDFTRESERNLEEERAEMENKQAKRNKALSIMSAIVNTAVGVTAALANPGGIIGIILAGIVGAMGAAQIALIAAQPIPGKEQGGYLDVERSQDGKTFHAEYAPNKRGKVSRPTVIVGENGTEYVLSANDMENPSVSRFVEAVEVAKLQGSMRDFDFSDVLSPVRGRAAGGYTAPSDNTSTVPSATESNTGSRIEQLLDSNLAATNELNNKLSHPLIALVSMTGRGGMVEAQEEYDKYLSNTNLSKI